MCWHFYVTTKKLPTPEPREYCDGFLSECLEVGSVGGSLAHGNCGVEDEETGCSMLYPCGGRPSLEVDIVAVYLLIQCADEPFLGFVSDRRQLKPQVLGHFWTFL